MESVLAQNVLGHEATDQIRGAYARDMKIGHVKIF